MRPTWDVPVLEAHKGVEQIPNHLQHHPQCNSRWSCSCDFALQDNQLQCDTHQSAYHHCCRNVDCQHPRHSVYVCYVAQHDLSMSTENAGEQVRNPGFVNEKCFIMQVVKQ